MPSPGEDLQVWSTTAINNGTVDPSINWVEGMPRAAVNNSARSMMAAMAKNRNLLNGSIVTTGTANAQAFSSGVGYTSVPTNLAVLLKIGPGLTNTNATVTLNMDGIGPVTVLHQNGAGLWIGELLASTLVLFIFNGTNWIVIGATWAQGQIPATGGNDNATAGNIGEFISSTAPVGAPVTLAPATPGNVTSISLTAGDWNVAGLISFISPLGTAFQMIAGISLVSATMPPVDGSAGSIAVAYSVLPASNSLATCRFSLAITTTVFLVGSVAGGGSVTACGTISARRAR